MTPEDARLLLQMRRPGDRDRDDPLFAEALRVVDRDPELKAWFDREQQRDRALAQKLATIAPPPGLREAILAGARASEPRRVRWWRQPAWLAAAAAIALLLGVTATLRLGRGGLALDALALAAAQELSTDGGAHAGPVASLADIQTRLAETPEPLGEALGRLIDLDVLRRDGCRTVRIAGYEMLEVCFQRGGNWFHVYVMPRQGAPVKVDASRIVSGAAGGVVAVAWSDAKHSYALVSDAGRFPLQRLL